MASEFGSWGRFFSKMKLCVSHDIIKIKTWFFILLKVEYELPERCSHLSFEFQISLQKALYEMHFGSAS